MTLALSMYRILARTVLEPIAPAILSRRAARGKERRERLGERTARASTARPDGTLVWLHGASVGESRLLLEVLDALRARRPDLRALITTQTLTSADMIAARKDPHLIHQMAVVDGPGFVRRFLDHWRPDAVVFAEGEIWPNMLVEVKRRSIPCALVNARMTQKSLQGWGKRQALAREVFSAFGFIGAADPATAEGLEAILGRKPDTVGNLKRASRTAPADPVLVDAWRGSMNNRPTLLAASTHAGEEEVALDAFSLVREATGQAPLLIIAPRHPDRGPEIVGLAVGRGFTTQLRSGDTRPPPPDVDVLVADTMGEMMLWYAVSDGVFLAGAHAKDVGGHNPIEPAQLRKRVHTGPHGFNFKDTLDRLAAAGAVEIGVNAEDLAAFWRKELDDAPTFVDWAAVDSYFEEARAPMQASLEAVLSMLEAAPAHA